MSIKTYLKVTFVLALAGVLFSGYLSATKLFTGTCAFNESCPYFLGYPACWYGFGMFLAMFIAAIVGLRRVASARSTAKFVTAVSLLGILFAGSFTWAELSTWLAARNSGYQLLLPTCVYGLVFYIAIFVASAATLMRKEPSS
jgi:uncharacterized membrane protein